MEISAIIAAAHELKAPLCLIRQLSLQLENTSDPREIKKITTRLKLTAERSLRLVNGLSRTARLEDAFFQLTPIDVGSVVKDVAQEISPLADALNQNILVQKKRQKLVVIGHFDLIRTILLGLLDNSLTSSTGKKIEIKMGLRKQNLMLTVRDHGQAIDKKVYENIMQNIGKNVVGNADRPLSSGLGLFIASKFTEYMHGQIFARRHRQGGMTFGILLPLSNQMELF